MAWFIPERMYIHIDKIQNSKAALRKPWRLKKPDWDERRFNSHRSEGAFGTLRRVTEKAGFVSGSPFIPSHAPAGNLIDGYPSAFEDDML
jgi:hypothetical protein